MSTDPSERQAYRKVTWRLIPLLFICYVFAYLDRVNVGFAKLQMSADLGLSDTAYGIGAGVFFLGYFVFEIPSNLALHRFGARMWIARIMLTWGAISGCMMLLTSPSAFYMLRFALGVAEAGFFPGVILYLTYWYPAARRGTITAVFLTGIPLAGVIGGPLSGWIMTRFDHVLALAGWRWLFALEALPSLLLGAMVPFCLDNDIASAQWLSQQEKMLLTERLAEENKQIAVHSFRQAMMSGRVWALSLAYFGLVMSLYGVAFWLPSLLRTAGVRDAFNIGLLAAVPYAAAAAAMVLVGRSADRRNERRWHVALPAIAGSCGLLFSAMYTNDVALTVAFLSIAVAGTLAAISQFWSLPPAFLGGAAAAGGIGLINSVGNLAGFLSSPMMGWISDHTKSMALGLECIATFLVMGGLTCVLIGGTAGPQGTRQDVAADD